VKVHTFLYKELLLRNIKMETNKSTPKPIREEELLPCPSAGMKCPCGMCLYTYCGICLRPKPCVLCDKDILREREVKSMFQDSPF